MKQTLKLGLIVLVAVALAATGVALAQSDDEETRVEQRPAYSLILERLSPLVDERTISQEQAEAVAEHLADSLPPGRLLHRGLEAIREAADFLGLTPAEIAEALRDGATLAEIAQDNGSSAEALIGYLVDEVEERLDQAVADGRITEEQKGEALERATDAITRLVNGQIERPFEPGPCGPMGRGGRGGRMGGGLWGSGQGGDAGFDAMGA